MAKIEKLEDLVKDYIGPNKSVVDSKITNLLDPGENYLSEIMKIQFLLKNEDTGVNEDLHVVAKVAIENEMGPTANFTKNEITFYKDIVPSIKRFHERHSLPPPRYFPNFLGGRINLTGGDEADINAVLVLENLIERGYKNLDRHVGYDLETAKLVLEDLATFHAAPLAMKLIEPEIFETEIKAKCDAMKQPGPPEGFHKDHPNHPSGPPNDPTNDPLGRPKPHPGGPPPAPPILQILLEIFKQDEKYSHIVLKYENFVKTEHEMMKNKPKHMFNKQAVEPYATLTHQDMWLNNTMQNFTNRKPTMNKIVDFQMCRLDSPAKDLIFLIFSSVQLRYLEEDLDLLLKHYYNAFAEVLKDCGCYGPEFSYDGFLEELKRGASSGILQCMFMISNIIFGKKGQASDMKKMHSMTIDEVPPMAKQKLILLCLEAGKRNWF